MIKSERHQRALDYAIEQIKKSSIYQFVNALYLYGSCSRGSENWDSDVDLFLELNEDFALHPEFRWDMRVLQGAVSSDELYDVETDLKIVVGKAWLLDNSIYYENIRKEGRLIWI